MPERVKGLELGDHLGLSRWVHCGHMGPPKMEKGGRGYFYASGFEDGGGAMSQGVQVAARSWEREHSLLEPSEGTQSCADLDWSPLSLIWEFRPA